MSGAFIIGARRTAVVPHGGAFKTLEVHELAAPVIAALLGDAGLEASDVDEVILANALGAGGNPARLAALAAGLPLGVAGLSIDRQCCGGMDAVLLADAMIRAGAAQVVIAGGAESWSRRPLRLRTDPAGSAPVAYDQPPFTPWADRDPDMAEAAHAIAATLDISRDQQDAWAIASHQRALDAQARIAAEIVPLAGVTNDPFARRMNSRICARAPVISGSITAANTAPAADGAAFCLVVSDQIARRLSAPRHRIIVGRTLGADPMLPGLAPVGAIAAVMKDACIAASDMNAVEIMEAFAVQAMACVRLAGLDPSTINRGGGALARGHPIGASGAVNLVRLCHELATPGQRGLAAIAAAGGLGTAVLLERVA